MPPSFIVQIPLHRFSQPTLEGLLRSSSKLALTFGYVNSIANIVARSIFDEDDQLFISLNVRVLTVARLVEQATDSFNNIYILFLIIATDIVGLTNHAPCCHLYKCTPVIFDK